MFIVGAFAAALPPKPTPFNESTTDDVFENADELPDIVPMAHPPLLRYKY